MAQEDILYYTITYRTDTTSLRDAADQLTQSFEQMQKATPKEILPNVGQTVQDLQKVAEATQGGIKTLVDLQKEIEGYRTELKILEEQQKLGIELTDDQRQQQAQLKVALKAASQEYNRQSQDLVSLSRASGESAKTYNELVKANKAISAELRNLPLDDTTGRLKELQKQYNANNDELKKFDASMGNHQRNVGNYEGSLKNVIGSLTSMQGASGQVATGIGVVGNAFRGSVGAFKAAGGGLRGFTAALTASGIGAILPIIGALITILGKIQPVVDVANRVVQAFSVTLKTVADRILGLVEAAQLLFQGKFSEAADKAKESFAGMGAEIVENVKANDRLVKSMQQLEEAEISLTTKRAQANKELAQARLDSRDENRTIEERISALQRALQIEEEIAQEEMRMAAERARILEEQVSLTTSSREELQELADAQARVIELETQSIMRQSEATERLNTLRREGAKESERIAAALAEFETSVEEARIEITLKQLEREGRIEEAMALEKEQRILELKANFEQAGITASEAANMARLQADAEFLVKEEEMAYAAAERQKRQDEELQAEREEAAKMRADAETEFLKTMDELRLQSAIESLVQQGDLETALMMEKQARFLEIEKQYLAQGIDAVRAANMAKQQSDAEYAQAEMDITKASVEFQQEQLLKGANAAIAIGENLFGKTKALSVAKAIIDTFASANAAFKDTPGNIIVRALAAGAAITAGLANVKKIISTKPGGGAPGGGGGGRPSVPGISGTIATGAVATSAGTAVATGTVGNIPATFNTAASAGADRGTPNINVEATVNRRGLALAVREGEQEIRTEQITFN